MKGIIASLITPLKDDQSFDQKSMKSLINHVIRNGVKGIFILGSIGEGPCFSINERKTIIESTIKYVKSPFPILSDIKKLKIKKKKIN